MALITRLSIRGEILRWARASARISLQNASTAIGVSVTTLGKWEASGAKVSVQLLERIADTYRRSTAVFFMPSVPEEPPTPLDFRTMVPGMREALTEKTVLAIRRARWLQRVFIGLNNGSDYRVDLSPLKIDDDVVVAAASARSLLGVSIDEQARWKSPSMALPIWRRKIEATGVLVFQLPMSLREARGFSLPGMVPVIVLNSVDEPAGRIFTLFHEWAHLRIGQPGLCNPSSAARVAQQSDAELFCNRFAGNFLVPREVVSGLKPVLRFKEGKVSLSYVLGRIAGHFAVSRQVALQSLHALGMVPQKDFDATRKLLAAHAVSLFKKREVRKSGWGLPWPERPILQLGTHFVAAVLDARERGIATDSDVSDYLSTKLKHMERIQELVA